MAYVQGFGAGERQLDVWHGDVIGDGGRGEDEAARWAEREGAAEGVGEVRGEGEVVRVHGRVVRVSVFGRGVEVLEAVKREEERGPVRLGQFCPEGAEDGEGEVFVAGAHIGEPVKRHVGLRCGQAGVRLGEFVLGKEGGVGAVDPREEEGRVGWLDVGLGGCVEGDVGCVPVCELHCWSGKVS